MEKEKPVKSELEKIRCCKCNSTLIYVRIKDRQRVCRNCGNIEDLDEEVEEKE